MEKTLLKIEELKNSRDTLRQIKTKILEDKSYHKQILEELKTKEIQVNGSLEQINKELSSFQQNYEQLQKEQYDALLDETKEWLKQAKINYERQRINIINEDKKKREQNAK